MPTATFQTPLVEKTIKAKYKVIELFIKACPTLNFHFMGIVQVQHLIYLVSLYENTVFLGRVPNFS